MNKKHIALLIDIDNVDVSLDNLNEIIQALKDIGSLDYIKLYGYNERRHTNWGEMISYNGIDTCSTMRFRKRNKSQIDLRLVVDAITLTYTKPNIDTFCIVAGNGDLVPLLTELRLNCKYILGVDTFRSAINEHLFNEHIKISGELDSNKARKNKLSSKLQQFSERTAAMAMDDNVDAKAKKALISEVEKVIQEMEVEGNGSNSVDEEERELFDGLKNILEILKTLN